MTILPFQSSCEHPAIMMGCNKLAYQIDLIQWCLEKARYGCTVHLCWVYILHLSTVCLCYLLLCAIHH